MSEPKTKKYLVTVEVEIHGSPMYPEATPQDAVRVVEAAMGHLHANGYDAAWESFDYSITGCKRED